MSVFEEIQVTCNLIFAHKASARPVGTSEAFGHSREYCESNKAIVFVLQ